MAENKPALIHEKGRDCFASQMDRSLLRSHREVLKSWIRAGHRFALVLADPTDSRRRLTSCFDVAGFNMAARQIHQNRRIVRLDRNGLLESRGRHFRQIQVAGLKRLHRPIVTAFQQARLSSRCSRPKSIFLVTEFQRSANQLVIKRASAKPAIKAQIAITTVASWSMAQNSAVERCGQVRQMEFFSHRQPAPEFPTVAVWNRVFLP